MVCNLLRRLEAIGLLNPASNKDLSSFVLDSPKQCQLSWKANGKTSEEVDEEKAKSAPSLKAVTP